MKNTMTETLAHLHSNLKHRYDNGDLYNAISEVIDETVKIVLSEQCEDGRPLNKQAPVLQIQALNYTLEEGIARLKHFRSTMTPLNAAEHATNINSTIIGIAATSKLLAYLSNEVLFLLENGASETDITGEPQ